MNSKKPYSNLRQFAKASLALLSLFAACVLPAAANVLIPAGGDYLYTGATPSSSAFDRPVGNGDLAPEILSDFADLAAFDPFFFEVASSGIFNMTITPPTDFGTAWSTYAFLYRTSFNPATPLMNVLLGESNPDGTSNLSATLTANTTYILVAAGFTNFDAGPYSGEITQVSFAAVPETSTFFLLTGGLSLVIAIRAFSRKRNSGSSATAI